MRARHGSVPFNLVRFGHLPQRVALVPNLATAQLARPTAQAALDPRLLAQTIARWRLAARQTVQTETAPEVRVLLLQRGDLGRQGHGNVES